MTIATFLPLRIYSVCRAACLTTASRTVKVKACTGKCNGMGAPDRFTNDLIGMALATGRPRHCTPNSLRTRPRMLARELPSLEQE
jgi:hypothetical protein